MNRLVILGFTVFGLVSICAADFRPCKFTNASTVRHREGIAVWRVGIVEDSGEIGATVLIPDSNVPLPGAIISHSSIHGSTSSADLLRFAWALARAGAAVIVLNGTLEWDPPSDESVRDPHLMACAGQWLLLNTRLDRHRLLVAGTQGRWGGGDTPLCMLGEKPCFVPTGEILFGETWGGAESPNTDRMLTIEGQLEFAKWAQEHLKLRQIKPEWLTSVSNSQPAAPPARAVNQERAQRLSDLPLDSDHFEFTFRITDDGGAMVVTVTDTTNGEAEEHVEWRLGQLARLALRCSFAAPEFRGADGSEQVRTLCELNPKISALRGHGVASGRAPQNGTLFLEFKTQNPDCIHPLQDVVRAIAARYPNSSLDDASSGKGEAKW